VNREFGFAQTACWSIKSVMAADLPTHPSLLVRLRDANDHAAWSQFVAVYTPLIFGFCCKRGLSENRSR
jgi:hypothetical protein